MLTFMRIQTWIAIDEGCNSNCHGRLWRENLESKMSHDPMCFSPYRLGKYEWIDDKVKSYSGIGENKTSHGKLAIPGCFRLKRSGKVLPVKFESNEQEGKHPLLLSSQAQAGLKFVKDMEAGTLTVKDQNDTIPMFRSKGQGLLVVNISQFPQVWDEYIQGVVDDQGGPRKDYNFRKKMWNSCLLYTSPSPRDKRQSRMPSSA